MPKKIPYTSQPKGKRLPGLMTRRQVSLTSSWWTLLGAIAWKLSHPLSRSSHDQYWAKWDEICHCNWMCWHYMRYEDQFIYRHVLRAAKDIGLQTWSASGSLWSVLFVLLLGASFCIGSSLLCRRSRLSSEDRPLSIVVSVRFWTPEQ